MKTIILASFLLLFLNSCALKKEIDRDIEFKIMDKSVKDNSLITLLIKNNTTSNYYLPIINSSESEKWKYILSADENSFFFIYKIVYNSENKEKNWSSGNCFAESIIDEELEKLHELWKQKKKSMEVKDLILLKSSESIKIKVLININLKITKECSWELENYKNEEELYTTINYPKKDSELADKFLSPKTVDNLKQMGYELYDKEINSNKVSLILK